MIRRQLTLKRVDPWSVLKFGFVVNVALLLVGLLAFWILWITIRRLGLIDQFCGSVGTIVLDLQQCSVNGGNIFRTVLFLGVLGVVVQTGIVVFGAFLYNLIADLTGGLTFSFLDESGESAPASSRRARWEEEAPREGRSPVPPSGGGGPDGSSRQSVSAGAAAGTTGGATSSRPAHDTGSFRPANQPTSADRSATGTGPAMSGPGTGGAESGPPRPPQESRPPSAVPRSASSADEPRTRAEGESEEESSETPPRPRPSGSSLWGDPTRSRE